MATLILEKMALYGLGLFPNEAKPAIPDLIQALNDVDAGVRARATNVFKWIAPEAAAKAGIK